jgi:DNA polymerase-3 subunit beta
MENQPAVYDEGQVSPAVYAAMIAVNERLASRGCTTVTPEQLLAELETYAQETGLSDADREMGKNKLTQLWLQSTIDYAATEPNGELKPAEAMPEPQPEGSPMAKTKTKKLQFTMERSDLEAAVKIVMQAVEKRSTIPILTGLRIRADKYTVEITGTDLEQAITVRAKGKGEGEAVLAAQPIQAALKIKQAGELKVTPAELTTGSKTMGMTEFGIDSWPELPKWPAGDPQLVIEAKVLRDFISRTAFAVSKEESRFTLNGVLFESTGERLHMIATDGHRMALVWNEQKGGKFKKLIPIAATKILAGMTNLSDTIAMWFGEEHLFFEGGGRVRLISRKLSGNFPDHERVMPKSFKFRAVLNTEEMRQALASVLPFCNELSHAVSLQFKKDALTISTIGSDNRYTDTIHSDFQTTSEVLGVNADYMLDYFRMAPEAETAFTWNGIGNPMELSPLAGKTEYRYIVMPMRV